MTFDLFNPPPVDRPQVALPRAAQATSVAAAMRVLPKTGTQRRRVLDYIMRRAGATDEEIGEALRIPGNSVRPRRGELVDDGWIEDSGITRLNSYGNACAVWWGTPAGCEVWKETLWKVIRIVDYAGGRPDDNHRAAVMAHIGRYVEFYDPNGQTPTAMLRTTADPAQAVQFPDLPAAVAYVGRPRTVGNRMRDDTDRIDRPLTAYTLEIA